MKQKSLKNTIRNIALVVLTVLLAVLTVLCGLTAVGGSTPFWQSFRHTSLGYEVRSGDSPAAYPSSVAMTGADGQLYGAAYNERAAVQLYEITRELMGGALGAAGEPSAITEDELRGLLSGETLCYAYDGEIPAAALASWMENRSASDLHISMLLLTREGRLVLRTRELGLTAADTTVDRGAWGRAAAALSAGACAYAGTSDKPAYRSLAAETLLFEDAPASADVLVSEPPAFGDPNAADSMQTLLGAFRYSVYARSYQERGTQVYVDNDSTLRIGADGTVRYTADRRESETQPLSAVQAIEQARAILEQAQYSIGAGTQAELLSAAERVDGGWTLLFGLVFEGIPVVTDEPYAQFEFSDSQLAGAVIRLRRYTASGERQYILPAAQAAAAAPRRGQRLGIAYLESGEGRFAAERCFTFTEE